MGLGAVIAVSISSMLGSGIFVLPGLAFEQTGASAWMSYLLAAICVLPAALSKSELATAMPTSGGTYVYLERTFGPLFGTIAGLGLWLSLLLKSAFALVGLSAYLSVLAAVPLVPTAISLLTVIVILNILGVGKVSKVIIFVVSVSIVMLVLMSLYGGMNYNSELLVPYYRDGLNGFFMSTGMVFVSFAGVTKIAAIAEEIKDPERNLPRGILYSLLIVTAIYCLVTFVMAGTLPQAVLAGNLKPVHTMAEYLGGHAVGVVVAVIAIVTMASMANAGILAASRFPFAMSRDKLLPKFLGKLGVRHLTPFWSIILSGAIVADVIIMLDVHKIAKLASAFMILIYTMENIAVILLRETRVQWYKPEYKSPFYPWVQLFGIISLIALLFSLKATVFSGVLSICVPGVLIYILYSRKRTSRMGVVGIHGARKDLASENEQDPVINRKRRLQTLRFEAHARVVVPLFGVEKSPEALVEVGAALADKELVEVAHLTEVPEQLALSDIPDDSAFIRSLRRRISALSVNKETPVSFDSLVSHDIFKTIHNVSQGLHCQWLVTEWGGKTRGAFTLHNPMGWLKNHLSCHLVMFRDAGIRYIRKVVVISRSDEHDRLIISTADHLARVHGATLTILKVVSPQISDDEEEALSMVLQAYGKNYCFSSVNVKLLKDEDLVQGIVGASIEYDLVVVGDCEKETVKERFFGSQVDRIIENVTCSVVSVRPANVEGPRRRMGF